MLSFLAYVHGNFVPKEGAHFCRENGRQLTFTSITNFASLKPPGYGHRALLASTNNIELCLGLCCKSSWCRHANLGRGKCYGLSCYGDECRGIFTVPSRSHEIGRRIKKKSLSLRKTGKIFWMFNAIKN